MNSPAIEKSQAQRRRYGCLMLLWGSLVFWTGYIVLIAAIFMMRLEKDSSGTVLFLVIAVLFVFACLIADLSKNYIYKIGVYTVFFMLIGWRLPWKLFLSWNYIDFLTVLLFALAFWIFYVGSTMAERGKSTWLYKLGNEERTLDPRPPIVYLRQFETDGSMPIEARGKHAWTTNQTLFSHEQELDSLVSLLGPFLALGKPKEPVPELGAARVYCADDQWQVTVDKYIAEAQLVIFRVGASEALNWEVSRIVESVSPERLALFIPPIRGWLFAAVRQKNRSKDYRSFIEKSGHYFPQPMPQDCGRSIFVCFDPSWYPILIGNYKQDDTVKALAKVLASKPDLYALPADWEMLIARRQLAMKLPGCLIALLWKGPIILFMIIVTIFLWH